MSIKEIEKRIEQMDNAPAKTVPAGQEAVVRATEGQTRAMWEIALQLAKIENRM